jgi:hypothetical protein
MRLLNEERVHQVSTAGDADITAYVRVRGVDGRAAGRGVLLEQHDPVRLVVRDHGGERSVDIAPADEGWRTAAFIAAPLAALILGRIIRRRGGR